MKRNSCEHGIEIGKRCYECKDARIAALESESAQYREAAEKAEKECERLREAYDSQEVQFVHTQASYCQAYEDLKTQFDSFRARPDDGRVERQLKAMREALANEGCGPWEEMGKSDQDSFDTIFRAAIAAGTKE